MSESQTLRWCPGCAARTETAPLPQLSEDGQLCLPVRPCDATEGFLRRNYCTACGHIWASIELPQAFVQELVQLDAVIEEQTRQIAMVKFLLANERKAKSDSSRESEPAARLRPPGPRLNAA